MKKIVFYMPVLLIVLSACLTTSEMAVKAMLEDDYESVKKMIEKGADVNASNSSGVTLLIMAVGHGDLEMVKYLINNGANINAQDSYGGTPLMAISSPYLNTKTEDIIYYLLDHGANPNMMDERGETVLFKVLGTYSIEQGSPAYRVLQRLITEGVKTDRFDNYGYNAISFYLKRTDSPSLDVVEFLLTTDIDINKQSIGGISQTALMVAASLKRDEGFPFVKLLIDAGADVNLSNRNGDTALFYAIKELNIKSVEYLLRKGADVNIKGADRKVPGYLIQTMINSNDYTKEQKAVLGEMLNLIERYD